VSITIHPELEAELRSQAELTGLSVESFIERIFRDTQSVDHELETLALEGLNSGDPIEPGPSYWADKHQLLEERFGQNRMR